MTEQYLVESVELRPSVLCLQMSVPHPACRQQLYTAKATVSYACAMLPELFFHSANMFSTVQSPEFQFHLPTGILQNPVDTYQLPFPTQLGPILVLFHILLHPKVIPYLSHRNAHPCEKISKLFELLGTPEFHPGLKQYCHFQRLLPYQVRPRAS